MHEYKARIRWSRGDANFLDKKYSRGHQWSFDGGIDVPASSSPHVVRVPLSVAEAVDPEEALVASASSCHMLSFLYLAALQGFQVNRYEDEAVGVMDKNAVGKYFVSRITLHPEIEFVGEKIPTTEQLNALHHSAHSECYIANSLKSEVVVSST